MFIFLPYEFLVLKSTSAYKIKNHTGSEELPDVIILAFQVDCILVLAGIPYNWRDRAGGITVFLISAWYSGVRRKLSLTRWYK